MTTTNNGIPYCAGGCGRMLHMDSSDDDQCVHCRRSARDGILTVGLMASTTAKQLGYAPAHLGGGVWTRIAVPDDLLGERPTTWLLAIASRKHIAAPRSAAKVRRIAAQEIETARANELISDADRDAAIAEWQSLVRCMDQVGL